ncbi:MAG: phosphatase PAP2 family protein [Nanoarchaeota archaeon]
MEPKIPLKEPLIIFFRDVTALAGTPFYILLWIFLILIQEYYLVTKLIAGFLFILFVTAIIRMIYHKERPLKQEYHNWMERIDASSFPSMHAARAFFFSLTLTSFFKYELWISVFLIALAILVSYSRIFLKKHDWWDLLGGIILGGVTFWLSTII